MKSGLVIALAAFLTFPYEVLSQTAYPSALIKDVPHVRQRADFCGEACVEMMLRKLGKTGDQNYVFNMSGLDPRQARGCYSADLARALKHIGFNIGDVFFTINAARAAAELNAQWAQLHADLARGTPSIICMRYDDSPNTTEHMRLVVGYEAKTDEVIYLDPAEHDAGYLRMKRSSFLSLWPLKYELSKWLVIRFRMEAIDIKESRATNGFTNADYVQHIIALKEHLPDGFSVFIERPFVVVGDGPPEDIEVICQQTIKWAVQRLKLAYFKQEPEKIITVWLFKDDSSYRQHTKSVFDDEPTTPYGYYSWDGAANSYGPDAWYFSVDGNRLVDTMFSNGDAPGDYGAYSPQRYTDTQYTNPNGPDVVAYTGAEFSRREHINSAYDGYYGIYYFSHGASNPVLTFTAGGSSANLEWARYSGGSSGYTSSDEYWALDNVVVNSVVPEPSSVVAAAFGFLGLIGWRWRRRFHA